MFVKQIGERWNGFQIYVDGGGIVKRADAEGPNGLHHNVIETVRDTHKPKGSKKRLGKITARRPERDRSGTNLERQKKLGMALSEHGQTSKLITYTSQFGCL